MDTLADRVGDGRRGQLHRALPFHAAGALAAEARARTSVGVGGSLALGNRRPELFEELGHRVARHPVAAVVGVTTFQTDQAAAIPTFTVDPDVESVQRARVGAVRSSRDGAAWHRALDAVREAARGDANLLPFVIAAVRAQATVGEISDALREVFGEASIV